MVAERYEEEDSSRQREPLTHLTPFEIDGRNPAYIARIAAKPQNSHTPAERALLIDYYARNGASDAVALLGAAAPNPARLMAEGRVRIAVAERQRKANNDTQTNTAASKPSQWIGRNTGNTVGVTPDEMEKEGRRIMHLGARAHYDETHYSGPMGGLRRKIDERRKRGLPGKSSHW